MIRVLIAATAIVGAVAFAAEKITTNYDAVTTPVRRQPANATSALIAQKSMDLADAMAGALGVEPANCDINLYVSNLVDQVKFARMIDDKVVITPKVRASLATNLDFKLSLAQDGSRSAAELTRALSGSNLAITAMTARLSGRIDFKADGTYSSQRGVWDQVKDDFDYVTVKGQWKILEPKKGDYRGLWLVLSETTKSGRTKTRGYRLGYGDDDVGFVPANRANDTNDYHYRDFEFVSNQFGGCED